jgi:hypothetical protein
LDSFGGTLVLDEADLPYSDAKADLVKILNNGTVKGMPVLRTLQNRYKEFNPYAFKVFGPKLIATRERYEDPALESRFLTEKTGTQPLRADIPIHLPKTMRTEALALRNRLLHFRLCEFFKIKTDPTALMEGVEPRLNQMALSLLSLVDDLAERAAFQAHLIAQNTETVAARQDAPEARVLSSLLAVAGSNGNAAVSIGAITAHFNRAHASEYGTVQARWVGAVARSRLGLATQKQNGVYIVPRTERSKFERLAHRYGIESATSD